MYQHLDFEAFKEQMEDLVDLLPGYLEKLAQDIPGFFSTISEAIQAQSAGEMKDAAHQCKGVLANFYITDLAGVCAQLEQNALASQWEPSVPLLEQLQQVWPAAYAELEAGVQELIKQSA